MAGAAGPAARRLRRELENLRRSQVPQIAVQPSEDNLLEWHFVLHSFGPDTPYHGGCYHGKIIFPAQYPLAPPAILMVTPSGRLETGKRLCLSMTDFHPESWNPAWSVETILVGLLSFFVSDKEMGYGAMTATEVQRKRFAAASHTANMRNGEFRALFPEFAERGTTEEVVDASASPSAGVVDESGVSGAEFPDGDLANGGSDPADVGNTAPPGAAAVAEPAAVPPGAVDAPEGGADAAPSAAPPAADAGAGAGEDDEPMECWMCRDVTDEPLIQPCACRGSMSGVHASCVEDWIRHHRRTAVNAEPPRCSVCNQYYRGQEQQPGVGLFIRQKCYEGARQLLRTIVLVVLVCGYEAAAEGRVFGLPPGVRVLFIVVFSLFAIHKLALLTVSLPLHRPPPQDPRLRRLFVADYGRLSKHIAEAFATALILSFGCITGTLPVVYFVPFCVASMIPVGKICFRQGPSMDCLMLWARITCFFICAPFICVGYPLIWTVRHPRSAAKWLWQSLHPLGPGPQIYVAIATAILCEACMSNVAPLLLWITHSALVIFGLLELFLVQKLPWKRSRSSAMVWMLSLQFSALATYFANTLCVFPQGWGAPDNTMPIVHGSSCLWFLLVSAFTMKVNWAFMMERYRVWQRRHGTFTLQVSGTETRDLHGVVATAPAPAPPV